jgi:hypothetical protein
MPDANSLLARIHNMAVAPNVNNYFSLIYNMVPNIFGYPRCIHNMNNSVIIFEIVLKHLILALRNCPERNNPKRNCPERNNPEIFSGFFRDPHLA